MRALPAILLAASMTGCMCRPGVVDCTTGRAYPAFCKPLCGGPCDPFVWLAGDCSCNCRCSYKGAYTPYGGWTCCGDKMAYVPSCVAPPLRWAPPAMPSPPGGHTVHLPPCPPPLSPKKAAPNQTTTAPPSPAPALPPGAPTPEPDTTLPTPPEASDAGAALPAPPEPGEPPAETDAPPVENDDAPAATGSRPRILHDARNDRWQLPRL